MIKFEDFFNLKEKRKTKIKFNMNTGNNNVKAWDLLLSDDAEWINMNSWKEKHPNNNMGESEYLLSFAQYYPYGSNYFIFGGYYKVEKILPEVFGGIGYKLTRLDDFSNFEKRLIIKLKKSIGRDLYLRKYENIGELGIEVFELTSSTKLGGFPGYNWVSIKHKDLLLIVNNQEPTWKQSLSLVKAVYAITDLATGSIYIGSAYGNENGLWKRWSNYAVGLTGDNKFFEDIKNSNLGENYIKDNFQYTIIEIFDTKTKDKIIIERESYWKRVFDTRKHGMNYN